MIIDLTQLITNQKNILDINELTDFDASYLEHTDIRKLSNVKVIGTIKKIDTDLYNLSLAVSGIMILPCAITLEDVNFPISLEINEILTNNPSDTEEYLQISNNSIDILPILWQNIVLEVPLRVVSKDAYKKKQQGEGWELITDEKKNKIDPRFDKLKDLLGERSED